ncbi:MAG: hypothetical protein QXP20_04800 [Candidatus Bathyarchaeia archaeon]
MESLSSSRWGVGSIIGMTIFFIIFMAFSASVIYWTITKFNEYNNFITTLNQQDWERMQERVELNSTCIVVIPGHDTVTFEEESIQNIGTIKVHIIRVWIIDMHSGNRGFVSVDWYLDPAEYFSSSQVLHAPIDITSGEVVLKIVTERGNIFSVGLPPM